MGATPISGHLTKEELIVRGPFLSQRVKIPLGVESYIHTTLIYILIIKVITNTVCFQLIKNLALGYAMTNLAAYKLCNML